MGFYLNLQFLEEKVKKKMLACLYFLRIQCSILPCYASHVKLLANVKKSKSIVQSNFGRSNSPVSNTRDLSSSFVGPGNFPIHLMLKYNSKHGPQDDFSCKNAMMAGTKYFFT